MKKIIMVVIIALALLMSAAGCGASGAAGGCYPAFDSMSVSSPAPVSSSAPVADDGLKDNDSEEPVLDAEPAEEAAWEPDFQDAADTMPAAEETDAMPAAEETDAVPAAEETDAVPAAEETNATPAAEEPDNRTEDEKLVDSIVSACSTQATAETDYSACVVDIRTALNPYDIEWDYGGEYTNIAFYGYTEWNYVFDLEYYKDTFPMLAMLYHDNDVMLKIHFTTVGIHEGRQGCEGFNVRAFMESCPGWIREAFGDNYACYYLYYIHSAKVDRTADMSGNGYPKQLTAVMTAVQKEEFDRINAERERLGVEPLVFDSELAAIANYRAWINADGNWAAHDWAKQHNAELWDMVYKIGGDTLSENTTSRFSAYYNNWYYGYYASKSHYDAMTNAAYNFVGNSNVYACDNTLEQYSNWKSDTRLIHFDVFMGTLDTALHSK